jgi:hypothetical protein
MLSKAPLQLAAQGYKPLNDYLTRPTNNDIGKARSFYVWIASLRRQQLIDFVSNELDNSVPADNTPLYAALMTLVKQWGNGYSEMFSKLCRYSDIASVTSSNNPFGSNKWFDYQLISIELTSYAC